MATCATPGTRRRRDRIFQYAMAERSVGLTVSEVRPIFMMRLVAESAGIMNGGLAHVGRVGVICERRSCTSWRAFNSSAPRSKLSLIEYNWATDFERISDKPSMPPN